MSFESALYNHLISDASLSALVSTRIYQEVAPTSATLPYMTWQIISDVPTGHIGAESGIARKVVQFDIFAATDLACNALEDELRNTIDGKSAATMGANGETIYLRSCRKLGSFQRAIPPSDGSQNRIYRRMAEYSFWHDETVPTLA